MSSMEQSIYAGRVAANTDAVSLERAAAELADMDVLYANYRGRIFRYLLLSLRDPDLAEGMTHDCLMKAHHARAKFRGDCTVATWLTKIATNLVLDHVRSRKLQFWKAASQTAVDARDVMDRLRSNAPSPEAALLAREKISALWKSVESLSPNQRSVFLLRFVEEMELAEISNAMSMNLSTVKSHLHRALQGVRSAMETTR